MKTTLRIVAVGITLLAGSAAFAADPGNMYINVNVGPTYLQSVEIEGTDVDFNVGARLDAAFGYHFTEVIALEFETGWLWNTVDKIGGHTLPSEIDYNMYQVPLLVNGVFHIPTQSAWKPYVGAGIGGVASIFALDTPGEDESGNSFTFAYQVKAGVGYAINENMKIDVGYKLLGTADQEWEFDHGMTLESDPMFTHALVASFTWTF